MIPLANPKMRLLTLSVIFLRKKKTKDEPNVVAMKMMDMDIIDTVMPFMISFPIDGNCKKDDCQ